MRATSTEIKSIHCSTFTGPLRSWRGHRDAGEHAAESEGKQPEAGTNGAQGAALAFLSMHVLFPMAAAAISVWSSEHEIESKWQVSVATFVILFLGDLMDMG